MKQKLLLKPLFLLCALLVGGLNSLWAEGVTDVLNQTFTGVTGTSYTSWSGKTGISGAVYAGQSAGDKKSIQLRSNNNNSGVITTTSGGKVKKITVAWNDDTADGRTLNIYGKNTAYTAATDLYNSSNQGTLLGTIVKGTSTELTISGDYEYIGFRSASGAMYLTSVTIDWEKSASDTRTATTTTIDDAGITNTNVFDGTAAGSLSATVAAGETSITGATVTWSGSDDAVATIDANGTVTLVGAGTVTFTATYAGDETNYKPSSDTYEMTVTNVDPNAPGSSAENAYTVAQARAAIDASTGVTGVYVKGIVSEIVTAYNSQYGNISYNISADGTTTSEQLQAYRGKSYNGDNFTSANDIQVGDEVVVYGNLKKHDSTYEFDANNQLVSLQRKELSTHTATFSINGEESTNDFKENANITFPADPEAISGMQFIGWTDAEISGTTNTAPTLISTATMGTTDVTYYAVFAAVTPGDSETVTDELTNATTGVEGPTYTEWTATGTSGAAYAGQSAGDNSSIQLRSKNSNSGIISTTSAGRVKKVVVVWKTNTTAGRTLDIYGNNTAYTKVTELYATGENSNQGTKLGSIVNGTSTELTIDGNYAYIGLRSYDGAMYLDKISITWECTHDIYSNYCTTIPTSIEITVSSFGYKAYNTVMATDFTKTEGLQAFVVTDYSDASVTLNEVEAAPAGTPLVLKANGGDYTLKAAEETPDAPAKNLLLVSNGTVQGDGSTIYALANVDGPGFYVVKSGLTIPTNYIVITGSHAPALSFDFGEGTTGIRSIENGQLTIDNVYYDLSGRKLNAMPTQKGVYIVNGKKVVIK